MDAMDESNQKVSIDDNDDDEDQCSICLGPFTNKALAKDCLHEFCYQCIYSWVQQRPVCPLCVEPIKAIESKFNDTYHLELKNEKSGSSNLENSAEEQEDDEENSWDSDNGVWDSLDEYEDYEDYNSGYNSNSSNDW